MYASNQLERRARLGARLLERVVVEPGGVALLDHPLRRVAHEQQLAVAEAEAEVGEEGLLRRPTGRRGNAVRGVHVAAGLYLVGQRHPAGAERLLPRVREVEGVADLMHRGP